MELATGEFPYPPLPSIIDLLRYIEEEECPSLDPTKFSAEFIGFTRACLIKDPVTRPTPEELLEYPFLDLQDVDLTTWAHSLSLQMKK